MKTYPFSNEHGPKSKYWMENDSEERFLEHLKQPIPTRALRESGYDSPTSIIYKLDKDGFRISPDVKGATSTILTLGCSNTLGVGLPVEEIWPTLLAQQLKSNVFNAGIGGASSDNAFRVANELIPKVKPTAVFHLVTFENRREILSEFVDDRFPVRLSVGNIEHLPAPELISAYAKIEFNEITSRLNQQKNCYAIAHLCTLNNAKYIPVLIEDLFIEENMRPFARDLHHPGKKFHNAVAKTMYKNFNI